MLNERKHDSVTHGFQFSREDFYAWLGKKVKTEDGRTRFAKFKLPLNIFLQDFQQSSKLFVSKGFLFLLRN